jgi:hypothetical protein
MIRRKHQLVDPKRVREKKKAKAKKKKKQETTFNVMCHANAA